MSYFFCLYIKKRPWPLSLDQSVLLGKCSSPVLAIKQTELFFLALWSDFVVLLFHWERAGDLHVFRFPVHIFINGYPFPSSFNFTYFFKFKSKDTVNGLHASFSLKTCTHAAKQQLVM